MKNLLLTLFVVPLFVASQLGATELQLIEVDPTKVFVDQGLFIEDEGVITPVHNVILRGHQLLAVVKEKDTSSKSKGWIFVFPPDAVKYNSNRPMSQVACSDKCEDQEEEQKCSCGCGTCEEAATFVKAKGALNSHLQQLFGRSADRTFPINANGGCGCKPKKAKHDDEREIYINDKSGDIIISISIDDTQGDDEEELVKIYVEDEKVTEILFQAIDLIVEEEQEEILDTTFTDLIFGYDVNGAYYYNPNSFFQVNNPTNFNPHR